MDPKTIGLNYDALAGWYRQNVSGNYGIDALGRALRFAAKHGSALDVGCGSDGRFVRYLNKCGFSTDAIDVSSKMIDLARQQNPTTTFYVADVCQWSLPRRYQFISAWDSTFHLPLEQQQPVLKKLCEGLVENGVLLFTCGGGQKGEITGMMQGLSFGYSTLGVECYVGLLAKFGCRCLHVEYDQWPENHVFIIAQRC